MSRQCLFFAIFLCLIAFVPTYGHKHITFVENGGQWNKKALYQAELKGGNLFVEKDRLTFVLYDGSFFHNRHQGHADSILHCHSYQLIFEDASLNTSVSASSFTRGKYNYYLGNDRNKWASGLRGCSRLTYTDLYSGVDLVIEDHQGNLKYKFVLDPGVDPSVVKMRFEGSEGLRLEDGNLVIKTSLMDIVDMAPYTFQVDSNQEVKSSYQLNGNQLGIKVEGAYDKSLPLVLDPELVFSTYSGSSANNFGFTATYDADGFLYSGGSVFSQGYPTTVGAFDVTFNSNPPTGNWGVSDIGISKYDTSGTFMIYSTYIGGSHSESPHSLIVNSKDQLYLYGTTGSSDYPITAGAIDASFEGGTPINLANGIFVNFDGGTDIIVTGLNADGTALLGSTYYGGSLNDGLNEDLSANYADQIRGEIILDKDENIVIATSTYSNDIITSPGAFQSGHNGGQEGLIVKFNPDLSNVIWSSYFGGESDDAIYSVIKSNDDNLYFAGGTRSSSLPISGPAYQSTFQGGFSDGFFAKLSNDGMTLMGGSYLGSDAYDQVYFVREDKQDQVYFFGQSMKFGTYWIENAVYNVPNSGQFISKFSSDLLTREWSTTFGSGNSMVNISPTAFMVDLCNKVYLSGWGSPSGGFQGLGPHVARGTTGMEITPDAYQSTTDGGDFYLMVLEDDASAITYGSFFGGNISHEHVDGGTSRFDSKGIMYQSVCAGCGGFSDFPIQPNNAVSPTNNSTCNNGVFKFDFKIPTVVADFELPKPGCVDTSYSFRNRSKLIGASTYVWHFGDGTTSTDEDPIHTFPDSGSYTVKLVVTDPTSCNGVDSLSKDIYIRARVRSAQVADTLCFGDSLQIKLLGAYPDTTVFNWSPTALFSNPNIAGPMVTSPRDTTLELVYTFEPGCYDTLDYPIIVPTYPLYTEDVLACTSDSINLSVLSSEALTSYQWSTNNLFSDTLNNLLDSSYKTGVNLGVNEFYIRVQDSIGCYYIDSLSLTGTTIAINVSNDTTVCGVNPIGLQVTSKDVGAIDSVSWEPGSGILAGKNTTDATVVPYDYVSVFDVYLRDTIGCEVRDTVEILNNAFGFRFSDTTVCPGDTVLLGSAIPFDAGSTYEWVPAVVDAPNQLETFMVAKDSLKLNLIIDNGVCKDTVPQLVHVNKIEIDAQRSWLLCNDSSLKVDALGEDSLYYLWSSNSTFSDTLAFGKGKQQYEKIVPVGASKVFIHARDSFACFDTVEVEVFRSDFDLEYQDELLQCVEDSIVLSAISDTTGMGMIQFIWSPDSLIYDDLNQSQVTVFAAPGKHWVWVEATNEKGCVDKDSMVVKFSSLDTSQVSLSIAPNEIAEGEQATLTVLPEGYVYELEGLGQIFEGNELVVTPNLNASYTVYVEDTIYNECNVQRTVSLVVNDFICGPPYVYVPNAFSPNGDGENDVLYVRGRNLTSIYFAVFNRWGQKVFETEDQKVGWDGYYKGMKIDPAVYDYYLRYECISGESNFQKGNITIIR